MYYSMIIQFCSLLCFLD